MNKNKLVKDLLGLAGVATIVGYGVSQYRKSQLNNHLSFAEKNILFWQKRIYNQKIKFFIRLRAHNWNELIKNRDHFFVYCGSNNDSACLSFAPRLSYAAQKIGINIYYLDTTKRSSNLGLDHLLTDLQINQIPAFLYVEYGKIVRYEFDESLTDFIEAHYK